MSKGNIVILTGAGISAESGLQTFRASDGLWCGHKVEEVATPEGFAKNPALVQQFYNQRRAQLKQVEPNAAHAALAKLAGEWNGVVTLVTQNVDDLHQRAAANLSRQNYSFYNMHGELKRARCAKTERVYEWNEDIAADTACDCCKEPGTLRPHIVWFGEMPFFMDEIYAALDRCDVFISIGTSGNVYPAAGFIQYLGMRGVAHTVELNLEPSQGSHYFDENHFGPATKIVPEYIYKLISS